MPQWRRADQIVVLLGRWWYCYCCCICFCLASSSLVSSSWRASSISYWTERKFASCHFSIVSITSVLFEVGVLVIAAAGTASTADNVVMMGFFFRHPLMFNNVFFIRINSDSKFPCKIGNDPVDRRRKSTDSRSQTTRIFTQ